MTDQKLSDIATHLTLADTTRFYGVNGATSGYTDMTDVTSYVESHIDYESPLTFSTGLTRSTNTVTVNTSQNIATLSNLTTNGFIKTSGGTGALSIDATSYVSSSVTVNGHALSSNVTVSASDLSSGTLASARGGAGTVNGIMKADGSGNVSAASANVDYTPAIISLNTQTGTAYTAVLGDATEVITMNNSSANTLTIPPNSSVAYPTGTQIALYQIGAGQTSIAPGSGVTINTAAATKKLRAQYSGATLLKTGTDTWLLVGDLAAS